MEGKQKRAEPKGDGRFRKRKSSSFRRTKRRADPVAGCRLIGRRTFGTAESRPPSWISAVLKVDKNSLDSPFDLHPLPSRSDCRFPQNRPTGRSASLKEVAILDFGHFENPEKIPSARPSIGIRSRVSSTPGSPGTPGTGLQPMESVQNKARGGHLGFRTPSRKTDVSIKCPYTLTTYLSDTASLCGPVVPQTPRV